MPASRSCSATRSSKTVMSRTMAHRCRKHRAPGYYWIMNASVADYAEHLTEADLRLLSAVAPVADGAQPALAGDRSAIEGLLADPRVFEAVFGRAAVAAGQAVL